ncbi:MAG: 50S ribosomal protein L18 [Candidatus Muiribacteriota bacterium]|jgi:large subunit ribosomal protein L18
MKSNLKLKKRLKRKISIRKKINGTAVKPRMSVYRSLKNIYVQLVDDTTGKTILNASTNDKDIRGQLKYGGNVEAAKKIGEIVAKRAQEKNITEVTFDRNGFRYHGRIKELADAARANGLKF